MNSNNFIEGLAVELIVQDSTLRSALMTTFQELGCSVAQWNQVSDFEEISRECEADLIIVDLEGLKLQDTEQLNWNPSNILTASLWLFIAGSTEIKKIKPFVRETMGEFVEKPINKRKLLFRIRRNLELRGQFERIDRELGEIRSKNEKLNEELQSTQSLLRNKIQQISQQDDELWGRIQTEIRELVNPCLNKIEKVGNKQVQGYVQSLKQQLDDIFEGRGESFIELRNTLTPREFEICNFVRQGMTSGEIAGKLGLSVSTIRNHRVNIREKLGLKGTDENLTRYLQNLDANQ